MRQWPAHGQRRKQYRQLTLDNFDGTLSFASNGDGGTLITDPPATSSITADGVLSLLAEGTCHDLYRERYGERP